DVEERVSLLEQRGVVGREIAAHGVDEDELALLASALLDTLLALGGGKLGEVGVELFGRGRLRLDGRCQQQQRGQCRHPIPGPTSHPVTPFDRSRYSQSVRGWRRPRRRALPAECCARPPGSRAADRAR